MSVKGDIAKEALKQFPGATTRTLTNTIYNKNKEVFNSLEDARSVIRYYRGQNGNKDRQKIDVQFIKKGKVGHPFPILPEGKQSIDEWSIVKYTGTKKILVIGDIHIPFHSKRAVELAIEKGKKHKVDTILLNGDIFDFFSISRWQKDPRKRQFAEEIKTCKIFMQWLRSKFPKAEIIFKQGNHEERYDSYMFVKAPELLSLPNFEFSEILEFNKLNITEVKDMRPIKFNELFVIHGHEYKFAISNPVNPARGLYLRSKVNSITNHFHQSSSHSEKDIEDKITACWSLGCLCDLHPDYMPLNKHNHGFGIIETNGNKLFNVFPYKIIDNEIYSE